MNNFVRPTAERNHPWSSAWLWLLFPLLLLGLLALLVLFSPTFPASAQNVSGTAGGTETEMATLTTTLQITEPGTITLTPTPTMTETPTPSETVTATPTITSTPTATSAPTRRLALEAYIPILGKALPPTPTPTPTLDPNGTPVVRLYCSPAVQSIPDNDLAGTSSTIAISEPGYLVDLEVQLDIDHTWVGDLSATLEHLETDTDISLFSRPGKPATADGCGEDNIAAILDDNLTNPVESRCAGSPAAISGIYTPDQPLQTFQSESPSGNWILTVADHENGDTGQLNGWCLLVTMREAPVPPAPTPVPPDLPDTKTIHGVTGQPQAMPLDCETRSAVDWANYFGVSIGETNFFNGLPESDDPDAGFVGNVWGDWGQVPPNDYGVHAEPIADRLRDFGLTSYAHRPLSWDNLRAEIAAGRPVIVWIIDGISNGEPEYYTAPSNDHLSIVARYEHTVVVTGYSPTSVSYLNGGTIYTKGLDQFLDSWSALGNMAVTTQP